MFLTLHYVYTALFLQHNKQFLKIKHIALELIFYTHFNHYTSNRQFLKYTLYQFFTVCITKPEHNNEYSRTIKIREYYLSCRRGGTRVARAPTTSFL